MPLKSKEEIVELLRRARPELERQFGITRLAVFGSRLRGDAW
jgi:predicted nucleotidyltransferase